MKPNHNCNTENYSLNLNGIFNLHFFSKTNILFWIFEYTGYNSMHDTSSHGQKKKKNFAGPKFAGTISIWYVELEVLVYSKGGSLKTYQFDC